MIDFSTATFSNYGTPRDLTLDDLLAVRQKLEALPKPVTDITVAPDVKAAMDRSPEMQAVLAAPHIWVDETVPAGHWHKGKPLLEQIREAADANTLKAPGRAR